MENRPWHQSYPKHVPHEIDSKRYSSVVDLIDQNLKKYASLPAYVNMDKALTFGEIDRQSNHFANYLQSLGLQKGDRIALQMPNVLQYPVILFGAIRAGLIIVNTNPLYTAREMAHQFNDSGAKAIVILSNFADKLEKILSETQIKHVVITRIGDMLGAVKGTIVNFVIKNVRKMEPSYHIKGAVPFKKALAIGAKTNYKRPTISGSDVGFLQYTGGTTGVSKGATLTHSNIVANMLQIAHWIGGDLKEGKEIIITALPLYHIFAFTVNCLSMLHFGAKNILITNPRDMPAFLKELNKHPFSVFTGVNTLFNGLMNQADIASVNFSHLKIAVGGGMAVQVAVNDRWKQLTGKPIIEGYGLSETSPVLSVNPTDGTDRIGTIGLPVSSTDLAIMDDDGNPLPVGERGEICARGPQVMQGYWGRPDETDRVFHPGGWFRTGDIGIMEPDGFFRIVDRKKDMILVSGFNVYPNEVEDVVAHHPGVLEVAALGVPDDKSTEAVKIFVVKKDPNLTAEALIKHCKENLAGYKVPKHVEFRDELPKSNVGKIIRRMLRDEVPAERVQEKA
ncbi:MAG: long-chain-fatty-acid--CoA ligase FadD [Bacteroidia bacterium]